MPCKLWWGVGGRGRPFGIWGQLGLLWRLLIFVIVISSLQIFTGSVCTSVVCTSKPSSNSVIASFSSHPPHLIIIVVIVTTCLNVLAKRKRFLLSNLCWSNIQLTMAFITVSHLKMNLLDTRKGSLIVLNNSGRTLYLLPYIRCVTTNASRYICDTAQFS